MDKKSIIGKLSSKTIKKKREEELEKDGNWIKTKLCIHFLKNSYRQKEGKGHAICSEGVCKIHYDKANPYKNPIKHIIFDSPYRIAYTMAYPIIFASEIYTRLIEKTENFNLKIKNKRYKLRSLEKINPLSESLKRKTFIIKEKLN